MIFTARVQVISVIVSGCILLYWFFSLSTSSSISISSCQDDASALHLLGGGSHHHSSTTRLRYFDMDRLNSSSSMQSRPTEKEEHVLILTPFKEAAQHIERYFDSVNRLTYPHHLISLGFLVSDSKDGTVEKLQSYSRWFASEVQSPEERFHRISIYQKDFAFELASDEERHAFGVQVDRRKVMAKSRNTLLTAALTEEIAWVLWLDGDVVEYPVTLLEELIALDKDVLAPNCWWHSYNEEGGYDKNNWQETPESLAFQETLDPEDVLVEGYPELVTHRKLMIDMRYENGQTDLFYTVPLDAVGGTCTLVRAAVHRDGAIFPAFPFQHQVETEGFAKMAKALGYQVWGLPNYLVYHYI